MHTKNAMVMAVGAAAVLIAGSAYLLLSRPQENAVPQAPAGSAAASSTDNALDQMLPGKNIRDIAAASDFQITPESLFVPDRARAGAVSIPVFAAKLVASKPVTLTGLSVYSDSSDVASKVSGLELWAGNTFIAPLDRGPVMSANGPQYDFTFEGLAVDVGSPVFLTVRANVSPSAAGSFRFGLAGISYPVPFSASFLGIWNNEIAVVQPPEISPVIIPATITADSGDPTTLTWRLPPQAVSASLQLSCPDGVSAQLISAVDMPTTDATNICNHPIDVSPTSQGVDGLVFTNLTGSPAQAVPNLSAVLSENEAFSVGVSSVIVVNPPKTSETAR